MLLRVKILSLSICLLLGFSACSIKLFRDHSRRFIFTQSDPVSGNNQIFLSRDGGPEEFQLTTDPNIDCSGPIWSPDGSRIAYTETDNSSGSPVMEVYVMNSDGSWRTHIRQNPGLLDGYPSWSPDGRKIAWRGYMGSGTWHLLVANPDGSEMHDLTPTLAVEGPVIPSWSPDGRMIVVSADIPAIPPDPAAYGEIVVVDVSAKTYRRLSNNGQYVIDDSPAWSPDGRKIAYLNGNDQVVTCNPDGSGGIVHTSASVAREKPCWSPDGRKILFHSQFGHIGNFTLRIIDRDQFGEGLEVCSDYLNTTSTIPITFSPDGQTVLYSTYSTFTTLYRILSVRTDGSGSYELKSTINYLDNPAWSPR